MMSKYKRRFKHPGWALDGVRVYHVKGIRTRKRVFRTKQAALTHLHRRNRKR